MTSFTTIPSSLQDAAMNQDGGNFSNFKIVWKKLHLTKNENDLVKVRKIVW